MEENKKEKNSLFKNLKKKVEKINQSKTLALFGALALVLVVFQMGVLVGTRKAMFHRAWGEHYMDNFGPKNREFKTPFGRGEYSEDSFTSGHGAMGKILRLEIPNIILEDRDNTEKIIVIKDDTKILKQKEEIKKEDLKIDDFLMIIGTPNDSGQIEAKFIRLMPYPSDFGMGGNKFIYRNIP